MLLEGNNSGFLIDDEDFIVNSRIQNRTKLVISEDDLSNHIKWKLFLARQLALIKYRQIWG